MVTPACSTFSRALFANADGPRPLRDATYPEGFPWLQGADQIKVNAGTALLKFAHELLQTAKQSNLFWLEEFPEDLGTRSNGFTPASPFRSAAFREFVDKSDGGSIAFFRCQWPDEVARKPSRFSTNVPTLT